MQLAGQVPRLQGADVRNEAEGKLRSWLAFLPTSDKHLETHTGRTCEHLPRAARPAGVGGAEAELKEALRSGVLRYSRERAL